MFHQTNGGNRSMAHGPHRRSVSCISSDYQLHRDNHELRLGSDYASCWFLSPAVTHTMMMAADLKMIDVSHDIKALHTGGSQLASQRIVRRRPNRWHCSIAESFLPTDKG